MRVAEKIDWLEFGCFYTKDDSVVHDKNLFSRDQIHNAWFGDRIMQILFQGEAKTRSEKDLLRRFCVTICPTAWLPYFDITQFRRLEYTVRGYAVTFEFGDPADRTFLVRVPMRIIDDFDKEHNFYCVENPRDHEFYTYNPYVGYRVVFTGHNIPFERRNGSIYPVRFSCTDWILDLQQSGRCCARMGRIDVALDIEYPFPLVAKLWQEHPEAFRVPFFKKNRRMDYNPFSGAGAICCGVRGKGNDAYMRIYNKSAEQGDCLDFYPWDDPLGSVQLSPVSSGKRQVYERPWTRIEFELRGYAGTAFLTTYADSILDHTTPSEFIFVSFGIYEYESEKAQKNLSNGQYYRLSNLPFWQDVIDSYQMYAKAGNQNFVQFREELLDKNFSVQAVGIRMAYNSSPYRTGLKKYADVSRVLHQFSGSHAPMSSDYISSYAFTVARASDIVEFVRSIPADYCSSANKSMVEDMQRFCGVSEARARDILNRSGMKGFVDEVRDKLIVFDGSDDPGDHPDPDEKFSVPVYSDFSNFLI